MSEITLRVSRDEVGQSVLRRTVRAVCATSTLPLDRVDDLLIICDELLSRAPSQQTFTLRHDGDAVQVDLDDMDAGPIVAALASSVTSHDGRLRITVVAR